MMGQERPSSVLLLAVLAGAALASGCTHTNRVHLDALEPSVQQRISDTSERQPAWVKLTDGQLALARGVAVTPDSTSWHIQHPGYRSFYSVPSEQVHSIRFKHRRSGAIEGLTIGSLVGAVTSFVLLLQRDSHSQAVRGVTRILPLSGLLGFIGGAMRGERERYVFRAPRSVSTQPVIPVVAEVRDPVNENLESVVQEGAKSLDPPLLTEKAPPAVQETPVAEEIPVVEEPWIAQETPAMGGEIHSKGKVRRSSKNLNDPLPVQEPVQQPAPEQKPKTSLTEVVRELASNSALPPTTQVPPPTTQTTAQPPARRPAPRRPNVAPGFTGWTMVVASLSSSQQLDATRRKYQSRFGSLPVNVVENEVNGMVRYHITVGKYETQTEAKLAMRRLTRSLPDDTWLLHVRPGS
jgi:hypothetical protein